MPTMAPFLSLLPLLLISVHSEESANGDPFLWAVEDKARLLPIQQFSDDPFLLQSIDRINTLTSYKTPYQVEGKETDVVYERNFNDKDKDLIVLSATEDHVSLKSHTSKQTFVVLRKNPKASAPAYYVAYAYLRNATASDPEEETILVSGHKKFIEWDTWEDRTLKKPVRWNTCSSSIYVACGFNSTSFETYSVASTPNALPAHMSVGVEGNKTKAEDQENASNITKPAVNKDDEEYEMDNYDFFDDLNIDLVKGRFAGAVGDVAGTIGGSSAAMVCGMAGLWGGTCGGGRAKKTIIIKRAPALYPINIPMMGAPQSPHPQQPPSAYIPLGVPVPPVQPYMYQVGTGVFYPDNRQIPPVDGTMIPFGTGKPFLFQCTDPRTFGVKLPKETGTVGSYVPNPQGGMTQPQHGIMLPVNPGAGIFIPDGMAYPSHGQSPGVPESVQAYSIPGLPGHPDIFVPDSDMVNPLRRLDPRNPIPAQVNPDPPNIAQQPNKPGQLLMNKMPIEFLPDSTSPLKSTFLDDARKVGPFTGFIIPGSPGEPETFIPDQETEVKNLKPPPSGTMSYPNKAPAHGILFPGLPGQDPFFIPDDAGGPVRFTPDNPSQFPSDGVLVPINPKTVNDYYPNQPAPPKPQQIPGTMTPINGKKPPMHGSLIVNKPFSPFAFIPDGVGIPGTVTPDDGRPPIKGVWLPPPSPKCPEEFVAYDEPTGGLPRLAGKFTDDSRKYTVPVQIGTPCRPGGPSTILGDRPPSNVPPPSRPPPGGGDGGGRQPSGNPPLESRTGLPTGFPHGGDGGGKQPSGFPPISSGGGGKPIDSGFPPPISGWPPTDSGFPPISSGGGGKPIDSGFPPPISGWPPTDSGFPPISSGGGGKPTDSGFPSGSGLPPSGGSSGFPSDFPEFPSGAGFPSGGGGDKPPPPLKGNFIPDNPPGGDRFPIIPNSPPTQSQPIPFTPPPPVPSGSIPRGVAEIPGLAPQHGKVVPSPTPTFYPDPPNTIPGFFTPFQPSGSTPSPGYIGPPAPPRTGVSTQFTPDNPTHAPKTDTPGTLSTAGQAPIPGILHPANREGGACPFTPFSESTFIPDHTPIPIQGSTPPGNIPNGDPKQEVPFYPDNPLQVPPGIPPQRGKLQRIGSPDVPGILKAPEPSVPGDVPKFIPDPFNSKPAELIPDQNLFNPIPGAATLPFDDSDPITFKPDERSKVPPGDHKGKLRIPGHIPMEQHGTIKNPSDPNQPVLFYPDKPAIFEPFTPPGSSPVPGSKTEAKGPSEPVKFYPNDPSLLTEIPTPGRLSTPSELSSRPITGILRPDYPPPAYSFEPFPQGNFIPDDTKSPNPGGVEQPQMPGQNPNFYPNNPSLLNPGPIPGTLQTPPNQPDQYGILMPCTSPPNGPRPFVPFPSGTFFPDASPTASIPVSVQSMGPKNTDPSKLRPINPANQLPPSNPTGTLKSPGKPDQHGTAESPTGPGKPSIFVPDAPGSRPSNFYPEKNPSQAVPGVYNDMPPTFKLANPSQLQPPVPTRGVLQPNVPPGSPPQTGTLIPTSPNQPWDWVPDPPAIFYPDQSPNDPVPGTGPHPKTPSENTPFYPNNAGSMPSGFPKGVLKSPGQPDRRGTMEPNPNPTTPPSWIFKPEIPDSKFMPTQSPGMQIPGTTKPPVQGGLIPFYPQVPAQMPPGGPFPGILEKQGQPPKNGILLPGQPYMFQETPASIFYPDKDPFNPVQGTANRPKDLFTPFPFDPQNPHQISPGQTQGIMKTSGVPDAHGYVEPGPGRTMFYPDPQGAIPVTFYPDRSPNTAIDGILYPSTAPSSSPDNKALEIFRAIDPSKLNPNDDDHGQMIPKVPPGSKPEFGNVNPPKGSGSPYTWTPDDEGVTLAWFYPESRPTQPIRGLYTPPPHNSPEGTPGLLKPLNKAEIVSKDEHGQLRKDQPVNSPPEIGTLKPPTSPGGASCPFVPDGKGAGVPATFYPDLNKDTPIEGIYMPPNLPSTPGTFKPKANIPFKLPAPGQMIPQVPNVQQVHGVLKSPPFPNLPHLFFPDEKGDNPEYEVSLVPMAQETPTPTQTSTKTEVNIRGVYYKSTICTSVFVAYTGTGGSFVINNVPPNDPKVQKVDCTFVPKMLCTCLGAFLTPDLNAPGSLNPSQLPSSTTGIFYPTGATVTGILGTLLPTGSSNEWFFRPMNNPEVGTWKPTSGIGCYTYNLMAILAVFEMAIIKKKQEENNRAPQQTRAFNFQGAANPQKWDIYFPLEGSSGKLSISGSQTVIHGFLKPDDEIQVSKGTFKPDDATLLQGILASGSAIVAFEQDETPAATGIYPNNGVAGTIQSSGPGHFSIVFTNPGRKGTLQPGKKPFPGFFVFCIGLVNNVPDAQTNEIISNPVNEGKCLLTRNFGKPGSSMSPSAMGRTISTARSNGRGFGRLDSSKVRSEFLDKGSLLNQDFASYLKNKESQTETRAQNTTITYTYSYKIVSEQQLGQVQKLEKFPVGGIIMSTNSSNTLQEGNETMSSSGSLHGTFYKTTPKDVFLPDLPGTQGTFYPSSGGLPPIRGTFFPPVKESTEMFWPDEDEALTNYFLGGSSILLVGKYVPDDTPGQSSPQDNAGLMGRLGPGKAPKSYIFHSDTLSQGGYISGPASIDSSGDKASGRSAGEDEIGANFVSDHAVDIEEHPGWKTQYEIIVPNVTLKYDNEIFFGFGNCPHRLLKPEDLSKAITQDEVIDFYMGVLRTYCIVNQMDYIKHLVNEGYIEVKNKLIVVPQESKYLTLSKLTKKQSEKLSAAFEMCVFTLTYADSVKKEHSSQDTTTFEGQRISRAVKYLSDMSILAMKLSRDLVRRHSVRLSRNLIITLTTALAKLKQDLKALSSCAECVMDKEIIHNDSMQLMGLIQYIMHGLSSIEEGEGDIRTSYQHFYHLHKELIKKKVVQINEI